MMGSVSLHTVAVLCLISSVNGFWVWNRPTERPPNEIQTPVIIGNLELLILQSIAILKANLDIRGQTIKNPSRVRQKIFNLPSWLQKRYRFVGFCFIVRLLLGPFKPP